MFLKCKPNPHHGGRMTRALIWESAPGQRFAIDAERLHKEPHLLNAFATHMDMRVRLIDGLAYLSVLIGFIAALKLEYWMFVPGLVTCVAILTFNRWSAGGLARRMAKSSSIHFRQLHEMGCLWLVPYKS